jgi:hypothetical protein
VNLCRVIAQQVVPAEIALGRIGVNAVLNHA